MRKRIISPIENKTIPTDHEWLNLESIVEVEITSEDPDYPIESALLTEEALGWRAADSGKQTIRLLFSSPQKLRRIWLKFEETQTERTQEYLLRWSPDDGQSFHEIVRQQWNFSPTGETSETEDHQVDLSSVTVLELNIIPDISGGNSIASLAKLRLA
jgi:hypothetical protein